MFRISVEDAREINALVPRGLQAEFFRQAVQDRLRAWGMNGSLEREILRMRERLASYEGVLEAKKQKQQEEAAKRASAEVDARMRAQLLERNLIRELSSIPEEIWPSRERMRKAPQHVQAILKLAEDRATRWAKRLAERYKIRVVANDELRRLVEKAKSGRKLDGLLVQLQETPAVVA